MTYPPFDEPASRADVHTRHAVAMAGQGRYGEAIAAFREAVRLLPDNAVARSNLAMTLGRAGALDGDEGMLAEAIEEQRTAVRSRPGDVGLRHRLAAILALADRVPEARAVLDEALHLDPHHVTTRGLRSVALLTLGDFERGWEDFPATLDDPTIRAHEIPGIPRWRGERLAGTLLLNAMAGGQGDCLQGIRFAAEARRRVGATALLCSPSLATLLRGCEGVDRVVTERADLPPIAAQIPPLHLAAVFRPTPATMRGGPYLSADPAAVRRWRPVIESISGFRVGISWQGNPEFHQDALRSFPLAELAPLAAVPGVRVIALQKGAGTEQLAGRPLPVVDLGPRYAAGDWAETAAIVEQLDLVISPDTALVHLAGALGRPTWLALARPGEWRWMVDREDNPWYPTLRLFRQGRPRDWAGVFRRMAAALAEAVGQAATAGDDPSPNRA